MSLVTCQSSTSTGVNFGGTVESSIQGARACAVSTICQCLIIQDCRFLLLVEIRIKLQSIDLANVLITFNYS